MLNEETCTPVTAVFGAGSVGMYTSMNKLVAKRILRAEGIPTPAWSEAPDWANRAWGQRVYDYYGAQPYWLQVP